MQVYSTTQNNNNNNNNKNTNNNNNNDNNNIVVVVVVIIIIIFIIIINNTTTTIIILINLRFGICIFDRDPLFGGIILLHLGMSGPGRACQQRPVYTMGLHTFFAKAGSRNRFRWRVKMPSPCSWIHRLACLTM
jgi:uncharacterized integral membrane protein